MTSDIANILTAYLTPLPFADKVAGMTKTVTIADQDAEGRPTKRVFPIGCNVSQDDCIRGKFKDLVPDKKYKSIMYFEDGGTRITSETPRDYVFTSSMRLVGWLNLQKLGKTSCSLSGLAVAHILKALPTDFNNNGIYQKIRIKSISQEIKSQTIFSKYSYKEDQVQYLMYPYDYFALNLTVDFVINKVCIEDWDVDPELNCVDNGQL